MPRLGEKIWGPSPARKSEKSSSHCLKTRFRLFSTPDLFSAPTFCRTDGEKNDRFLGPLEGRRKPAFGWARKKRGPRPANSHRRTRESGGTDFSPRLSRAKSSEKGPSTCKISSSYSGKRWHRLLVRATRANRRAAGTPLLVRRPLYGNAAVDKVEERALVRRVAKEQRRAAMVTHARGAAKRAGSHEQGRCFFRLRRRCLTSCTVLKQR